MCREKIIPPSLILVNIKLLFIKDVLFKVVRLLRKNDLTIDADHTELEC